VLATPVAIYILFQAFYINPCLIYASLVLSNILILFTIYQFYKLWRAKKWVSLGILPILFNTGVGIYSTLLMNSAIVQFLFFINLVFIFYYLRNAYYYFKTPRKYAPIMQNFSSYGNFLIIFFISASIFGLHSLLNVSIWLLMMIFAAVVVFVTYEVLITNEINGKGKGLYIFLYTLALVEFVWAIYFLPLNYNILGLAAAICYYVLIGLLKFYLKDSLDQRATKIYLTFGIMGLLLLLLTAQWR